MRKSSINVLLVFQTGHFVDIFLSGNIQSFMKNALIYTTIAFHVEPNISNFDPIIGETISSMFVEEAKAQCPALVPACSILSSFRKYLMPFS